jgi:hypothetical protein
MDELSDDHVVAADATTQRQASDFEPCLRPVLADIESLYSLTYSTRQRLYSIFVNLGLSTTANERLVRMTIKSFDLNSLVGLLNDMYHPDNVDLDPGLQPALNVGERRQLAAALDEAFVTHGLKQVQISISASQEHKAASNLTAAAILFHATRARVAVISCFRMYFRVFASQCGRMSKACLSALLSDWLSLGFCFVLDGEQWASLADCC